MATGLSGLGSLGSASGSGSSGTGVVSGAFGDLKSEDFLKVMMSELKQQDPLQPQDSSKLLEQLSSLRNIESQLSLQKDLGSLVLQNQVSAAGGLIGKLVAGLDDKNNPIEGLVTSVRVEDGKAILELDTGHALGMDRVTQIGGQEQQAASAATLAGALASGAASGAGAAALTSLVSSRKQ